MLESAPMTESAPRSRTFADMKTVGTSLAVLLLLGAWAASAQDAGPSVWSGVFTAAQAKRGEEAYQSNCSGCHGGDLHATNSEAPDLTGPALRAKWTGRTLADRFETIRDTMPPGSPNSVGEKSYLEILTFILQSNDVPTGNQELSAETAKRIVFAPKP